MRALTPVLLACAVLAAGCGSEEPERATAKHGPAAKPPPGAPAPLAKLYGQANRLLGGGAPAFRARVSELKGYPIVVNKWASWCPPCRAEFPFFRRQAAKRGREVAFIGVDGNDKDAEATEFLRKLPVSYPSYKDPKLEVSAVFNAVQAFPATAFYDSKGGLAYVHQGGYSTERKLAEDIDRYAR